MPSPALAGQPAAGRVGGLNAILSRWRYESRTLSEPGRSASRLCPPLVGALSPQARNVVGRVPIWAQWSIIGAGVLLCPLLIMLSACVFGWLLLRRFWVRPRGSAPVETEA